jgi:hypothetical protein
MKTTRKIQTRVCRGCLPNAQHEAILRTSYFILKSMRDDQNYRITGDILIFQFKNLLWQQKQELEEERP